jgi:DNA-binding MarR family transcriptional regulator
VPGPQITANVLRLFSLMTAEPLSWWWGVKLSEELDLRSGTIYPLLARLEGAEWLESRWEEVDPVEEGRPRRRLYRLTGQGEVIAAGSLAEIGFPASRRATQGPSPAPNPELGWT